MPQTKTQRIIFGLIMSYAMAIGMEVYNIAIKMGYALQPEGLSSMTNAVFPAALVEMSYMGVLVFLFSSLYGNRCGAAFAARVTDPKRDAPYFCQLMRQAGTIVVMCPTMSMVASILFSVILAGRPVTELPAIWIGTVFKNFPMAFFWNMFAAAPFTRWLFRRLFSAKCVPAAEK